MSGKVRPRIALRLLLGLVVAPAILLGGLYVAFTVVLPLLFPSDLSLTTLAAIVVVSAAAYLILQLFFEMDLLSDILAWWVGKRWGAEVETSRVLKWFFYTETTEVNQGIS